MNLLHANDTDGAYPQSWYAATAAPLPPFAPLLGESRADVAIVGAGYTGLSAALHLAQRGYDVTVLEAQRVGFGASGRNGGQLSGGLNWSLPDLAAKFGPDTARHLFELTETARDMAIDLVKTHAPEADFRPGILHADWHASEVQHSHREAQATNETYGTDIQCLTKEALADTLKSPVYAGGTLDMAGGHIHPLRYAFGLAKAAKDAGAKIHESSEVIEILEGSEPRLRTRQGILRAKHLILACNGYLGTLNQQVASRVMPINNFIAATEPLGERAADILARDLAVADSKFVINYFRLSEDKRLLFGGGESYGYRFPADIRASVRKPLEQVFPQLSGVELTHAWGGTLAITMNRLPCFMRLSPNILSASGYSGHGVALASFAGQLLAEAIDGQASRFDTLAALPSPGFPGGARLRSPLLALAMSWYALRDRLGF